MTDAIAPPSSAVRGELRTLARLALPIAVAQAGIVAMSLVDIAIVGHVSVDALAATAMGRSLAHALGAVGFGVASALDALASQAIGAGRGAAAWSALRATLRACTLTSLVAFCVAFGATWALAPFGVDAALVPGVRRYLLGNLPSFFLFPAFLAGKSFLQAHGQTRPALLASLAANVVNVGACNLLVRGDDALFWLGAPALGLPRLGAMGAGLAASLGSVVLSAIVLGAAAQHRRAVPPEHAVPVAVVYRIGLPLGFQLIAESGVFASIGLLAGRLGAHAVSAHQIALGLASFTFMGALGIGGATAVRVGHAVGRGASPRRAGLLGLLLGAALMAVSATTFAAIPRFLLQAFTPDEEVLAIGVPLLRIAAAFQLFDALQAVAAAALRGAGDVRFPFLANVGAHWGFGVPLALALCFGADLGVRGLWMGLTAGLVAIAVLLTARFVVLTRGAVERLDLRGDGAR